MRKLYISLLLLLTTIYSFPQYKIDLSKTTEPTITPIPLGHKVPKGKEIEVNNQYMTIGGQPVLPVMGEFHYSRYDHRYWKDALQKMKASGITIVATYALWSLHEEFEGCQSWEDNLDLRKFVQICQELDLLVHLRIGPYCNAEINNGALPDWIVKDKRFNTRSNDPLYLEYSRKWYQSLYAQVGDLLYKNGGPIMAIQLENEFVKSGLVISHLMNFKRMAVEVGFDVPLYSMTHWMDSEYPKGEIIPYAGYYIETPWTASGKKELPISGFEYFSYNRISNNIGTDIIKIEGDVESLGGIESDSPYFTCEVGVGTTSFYYRRAIIPQEMAGENINLRLGCGVNLMGYYMYVGGSNPVGEKRTFESSGPRISYDYQAPIREFGTLGDVMYETKKYNYFMNDFGTALAPAIAYLPVSNKNTENLQWAVRETNNTGFLFCSNYLYKNDRKDYKNVQFNIKTKQETLKIPRKSTLVKNGSYFLWPFNQDLNGILLKYSTTQPICSHKEGNTSTYFFFQDDNIEAEYLIENKNIKEINVINGINKTEKGQYFINGLKPGKDCKIEIVKTNGDRIILITLTEKESDDIWKLTVNGKDFIAITPATLVAENNTVTLLSETPEQEVWQYGNGAFTSTTYKEKENRITPVIEQVSPMQQSAFIKPASGNKVKREFDLYTYSTSDRVYLRVKSDNPVSCIFNDQNISLSNCGEYLKSEIPAASIKEKNSIIFTLDNPDAGVIAEIEVLLKNGSRILWTTDNTWTGTNDTQPVICLANKQKPSRYGIEEKLAIFAITVPDMMCEEAETRAYISYNGDVANAYIGSELINDSFNNGTDWVIGLSRFREKLQHNPLIIRIDGLKSLDNNIYFEKAVNETDYLTPGIKQVIIKKDYRFVVKR